MKEIIIYLFKHHRRVFNYITREYNGAIDYINKNKLHIK